MAKNFEILIWNFSLSAQAYGAVGCALNLHDLNKNANALLAAINELLEENQRLKAELETKNERN